MGLLPGELAQAARSVAEALARAGHRAWVVGGAVRDLALAVEPHDIDLASAALPAELERMFSQTYAVGRAFGTVVVRCGALDVQVTTFRAEAGYDDARRPSEVRFSMRLEEDAARRDFTCNALYLDPLTDELADPTGGLADLAAQRLRCVGEPARRFAEDGLRLLRLARLAAHYGLTVEPATLAGARDALDALRGVSCERVFGELQRMGAGRAPTKGLELLAALGVLERLPGFENLAQQSLAERVAALARLEAGGTARFFALLLRPGAQATTEAAMDAFWALRPPRELHQRVGRIWALLGELRACLSALARAPRSRWVRLVRANEFDDAFAVWCARHPGELVRERTELRTRAAALTRVELWPAALITSSELAQAGIPRGPRWGELLYAGEDAQLDGEFSDLAGARAWLAQRTSGR